MEAFPSAALANSCPPAASNQCDSRAVPLTSRQDYDRRRLHLVGTGSGAGHVETAAGSLHEVPAPPAEGGQGRGARRAQDAKFVLWQSHRPACPQILVGQQGC